MYLRNQPMKCGLIAFIIFNFFFIFSFNAQDILQTKYGLTIKCKIVFEDSLNFFFLDKGKGDVKEIKKVDVKMFYFGAAPVKPAPVKMSRIDSLNLAFKLNKKPSEAFLFDFKFGGSIPVDDFGSKDPDYVYSGLAETGVMAGVTAQVKVLPKLGFTFSYQYQENGIVDEPLLANRPKGSTISSKEWIIRNYFAGISVGSRTSELKNLAVNLDFSVGKSFCATPEFNITVKNGTNQTTYNYVPIKGEGLSFMGGVNLRYYMSDHVSIKLDASYLYTKPVFNYLSAITSSVYKTTFFQTITTMCVTGGLCFSLYN